MRVFKGNLLMRKYYTLFSYVFIFCLSTLTFSSQTHQALAQKKKQQDIANASPLYQCWVLSLPEPTKLKTASDNEKQIFISYQNGTVGSFDLNDGNQNWKTELGGKILSLKYQNKDLYVVSLSETGDILSLRSLGAETGIAKWQKSLSLNNPPNIDNYRVSLNQAEGFLFLTTETGDLYKFLPDTGDQIEKVSFNERVITQTKVVDQKIVFGTDKRNIIVYSIADKTVVRIALTEVPTVLYADSERIIVGDKLGRLFSFKGSTNKKEWETRVGAEVSDITRTDKGLVGSSNDNFVYFISLKNGGKIWKRRFTNRTMTSVADKSGSPVVAVNLNSSASALLAPQSGKMINQIMLPTPEFFVGEPFIINDSIIFRTNTGLTAYSSDIKCSLNKRPELTPGL